MDRPSQESKLGLPYGTSFLQAVNAAAVSLQRSARSEADVYQAFREQVIAFGLQGGLGSLDESGKTLTIRVVALSDEIQPLLDLAQQQSGRSAQAFSFTLSSASVFEKIVRNREPIFLDESNLVFRQMATAKSLNKAKTLLENIGQMPVILAPLFVEGSIFGIMAIAGDYLTPVDLPTIEAFANHISIALENAYLITALRMSEEKYRQLAQRLTLIREIDQAILTARSKEVIARVGLERLRDLIPFQRASVALFDRINNMGLILAVHSDGETFVGEGFDFRLAMESEQVKTLLGGEIILDQRVIEGMQPADLVDQLQNEGIDHYSNIPLISHGQVIGSLNIGRATQDPFVQEEIEIATEVAALLAVAIQDSRYLEAELRRRQEAETLISITSEMTSSLEMDKVLNSILAHLNRVVPYDSACIFLLEDNHLLAVAGRGFPDLASVTERVYPADDKLTSQVLDTGQPVILQDARVYPDFNRWGMTTYTRGWMGVPLIVRESTIGFLSLDSKRVAAYGPAESELAQAVANQAAITIENARLFAETQRLLQQTVKQATQLQHLMDMVPDGIVLLNHEKRIVLSNQAAAGYLAKLFHVRVGDLLQHLGNTPLDQILQTSPTTRSWHEVGALEPGIIFEVSARPLDDSTENSDWILILRNVTEVRKQEGYLRTQDRLATVGQLAAGIAHDFNNIMTVISLYTQLVLRTSNLPDKDEQRLNTIQLQAERASELIRQILDFSRQSVVDRKPLDLLPFFKELSRALRQSLPSNIKIETDITEGEYLVEADTARLRQAITNLAINARDAMPEGGTLKLSLSHLTLQQDHSYPLPDLTAGEWITLIISDDGDGIAPDDLSRVFEPFFTTKPTGEGTGLGLAQVYGIVKLHDGFIDVTSEGRQGASFSIYLPAFVPPVIDDTPINTDVGFAGAGETILLVEDDQASREALTEILVLLNYKVLTAANGAEALSIFENQDGQIDLVVTDMVMPVMNGAALYRELKARNSDIRLIVVTGYPLDRGGKEMLKQGVVAYIQKPLQVEVIAQAVRNAILDRE